MEVVLIGGPEEKEISADVLRRSGVPVRDWTGELSLAELVSFLNHERVKTLVSSDSGPVHIAWMLGKPVVALYAENCPGSNPLRWGPLDKKSEVIFKPIDAIGAEEVWEAVKKVLRR